MKIPESVPERRVLGNEEYICKLNKALYKQKVSLKCWYKKFKATMMKMQFNIYSIQTCIFYLKKKRTRKICNPITLYR